jgi:hypothetical protein
MPQTQLKRFSETALKKTRGKARTLRQLCYHIERGMAAEGYPFKMANGLNAKIYALSNPKLARVKKAVETPIKTGIGFDRKCVVAVSVHRKRIYLVCYETLSYRSVLPEMWRSPLPTFDSVSAVVFRNVAYYRKQRQMMSVFFKAITERLDPDIIALMTRREEKPWCDSA